MVRRFIFISLALVLILAAALMTALFLLRYPTPAQFRQATAAQPVQLPRDEVAHFDAQAEWWYYTGFLTGQEGQRYGFELVFFKVYIPAQVRIGYVLPLNWVTNPLYFAHLAVNDQGRNEHTFYERASFPQVWAARARDDRFDVSNGDWRVWGAGSEHHLQASGGPYSLRLDLKAAKPPALHGPEGVGVVAMGQGGTSYYYSFTDLAGDGLLTVDGVPQAVQATAWMDHQWGSWEPHGGFAGWDWFSLRLDDGSQVMLFDFLNEDGSLQPGSGGTWIAVDGSAQYLSARDYKLEVLERWASPATGATYPIKWHLTLPGHGVDATVESTFPEQEMAVTLGPVYWEGSVTVDGTVKGLGFVEMTGYVPTAEP